MSRGFVKEDDQEERERRRADPAGSEPAELLNQGVQPVFNRPVKRWR